MRPGARGGAWCRSGFALKDIYAEANPSDACGVQVFDKIYDPSRLPQTSTPRSLAFLMPFGRNLNPGLQRNGCPEGSGPELERQSVAIEGENVHEMKKLRYRARSRPSWRRQYRGIVPFCQPLLLMQTTVRWIKAMSSRETEQFPAKC